MPSRGILALALIALVQPLAAQQAAAPQAPPSPCRSSAVHRQFDFWIGSWDVYRWDAPPASESKLGSNDITVIEEGCALHESWRGLDGSTGRSFNWFDRNVQSWRQLWIDQSGVTLDYTSAVVKEGEIQFSGWTLDQQRRRVEQRLTFTRHHADTVRQLFETSLNSGRSWIPGFDGRYVRRK